LSVLRLVFSTIGLLATLSVLATLVVTPAQAVAEVASPGTCPQEQARQERGSLSLPDCRAYELVTPPNKNGALIQETLAPVFQIAGDGQRVISTSYQCFAEAESCVAERGTQGVPYEFARLADGWLAHPLAPPATSLEPNDWRSLNADTGTVVVSAPTQSAGPEAFFTSQSRGPFTLIGPVGDEPKDEFRETQTNFTTEDGSHIVYETSKPFWAFDPTGHIERSGVLKGLYEYVGTGHSAPLMVGVKGGFENHEPISDCGTLLGGPGAKAGAMSGDGRTIYFTPRSHEPPSICPRTNPLYVRLDNESADARSVLVSGPTPGVCTEAECVENASPENGERARDAKFESASADGSRVVFQDGQQLTNNASESSEGFGCGGGSGCNLYESECSRCSELTEQQELTTRRLVDISEGAKERGGPRVQGIVAMSADGSHVYFVAKGVLTGEEENGNHERAIDGKANLYLYAEGKRSFVAVLAPQDDREWEAESNKSANVTPDGRFLVFTSHRALTSDDTRPEEPAPAQVYEYDATTRTLARASIGDQGFNDDGNTGAGNAKIVLASRTAEGGTVPQRLDPTMSDDGAYVFFQSPIALTPQALNDVSAGEELAQNVYEYHDGRVFLLSDGKDTSPAGKLEVPSVDLLGSDLTGSNVFFATFDPLLPEDVDTQRDVYDARICGEAEPCAAPRQEPPALCEGEACHGTPPSGALIGVTPGSASFAGAGNLAPVVPLASKPSRRTVVLTRAQKLSKALHLCRKKHRGERKACERKARRAHGTVNARRSSKVNGADHGRRAGK
jgi:hypothetical protein